MVHGLIFIETVRGPLKEFDRREVCFFFDPECACPHTSNTRIHDHGDVLVSNY